MVNIFKLASLVIVILCLLTIGYLVYLIIKTANKKHSNVILPIEHEELPQLNPEIIEVSCKCNCDITDDRTKIVFKDEQANINERLGYALLKFDESEYLMKKRVITIGRDPLNDIVITNDRSISRYHCIITYDNDNFYVNDKSSTNGTLVNGKLVRGEVGHKIEYGDIISMGQTKCLFQEVF